MRCIRGLNPAVGALVVSASCLAPTATPPVTRIPPQAPREVRETPSVIEIGPVSNATVPLERTNRQGPRVRLHIDYMTLAATGRVRASFDTDDDAYVVAGHLGPDGVLRIVFPATPIADGFVRGKQSYPLPEIFVGIGNLYRSTMGFGGYSAPAARFDSYDPGSGFLFAIASWRPMRFDRFALNGKWDTFEVADEIYRRDPRPTIDELAALLAGERGDAYSIEVASYVATQPFAYIGRRWYGASYGAGYCVGYQPFGNAGIRYQPFGVAGVGYPSVVVAPFVTYGWPSGYLVGAPYRHGYALDPATGCYRLYTAPLPRYATNDGRGRPDAYTPKDTPRPRGGATPPDVHTRPRGAPAEPRVEVRGASALTQPEYRRREPSTGRDSGLRAAPEYRRPTPIDSYQPPPPRAREPGVQERGYTRPTERGLRSEPRTTQPQQEPRSAPPQPEPRTASPRSPLPATRSEPRSEPARATPPPAARSEPRVEPRRVPPPDRKP
jgi:hypothetical protein